MSPKFYDDGKFTRDQISKLESSAKVFGALVWTRERINVISEAVRAERRFGVEQGIAIVRGRLSDHALELQSTIPGLFRLPLEQPGFFGDKLSVRQQEILSYVSAGLTNAQIATRAHIARSTVAAELTAIYRALGITSRIEAVRLFDLASKGI